VTAGSIRFERQLRMWLVLGPSLTGFPPLTGFINPFWGSLSDWPLYLASRGHGVPVRTLGTKALPSWPARSRC
jgi:hypothetical protein